MADDRWSIAFPAADLVPGNPFFFALRTGNEPGSAVIPFAENFEGSPVFLAFQPDRLYLVQIGPESGRVFARRWENWKWTDRVEAPRDVEWDGAHSVLRLPLAGLPVIDGTRLQKQTLEK